MTFKEFKELTLQILDENKIDQYELYYSSSDSTSVSIFRGEVNDFSSSNSGGVCLRLVKEGRFGYASTESMTEEDAKSLVKRAIENALSLETSDPVLLSESGGIYTVPVKKESGIPSIDKLIAIAKKGYEDLTKIENVSDRSESEAMSEEYSIAICNSNGVDLSYENRFTGLYVSGIVEANGEMTDGMKLIAGDIDKLDTKKAANEAAEKAKAKIGAQSAPTGVVPVLFAPEAMTSLLATFSSIFSAESAQKGLSKLNGKEGSTIASELLSIKDDPFYKDSNAPIGFDAEGSPSYTKNVIKNGKLETLLYNLKTAAIAGRKTTGNAAKGSYSSTIGTSPYTFYIEPGELTEEEIIKKCGNGIMINYLGGTHAGANVVSGDFSLQSAGFMIENGKKTKPVKSFTVAGNFYELLNKITAISNDVVIPMPFGSTSFGSPYVLVENLSIAGK